MKLQELEQWKNNITVPILHYFPIVFCILLLKNQYPITVTGYSNQKKINIHFDYSIYSHLHTTADEYDLVFTFNTTHSIHIVAESFVFPAKVGEREINE